MAKVGGKLTWKEKKIRGFYLAPGKDFIIRLVKRVADTVPFGKEAEFTYYNRPVKVLPCGKSGYDITVEYPDKWKERGRRPVIIRFAVTPYTRPPRIKFKEYYEPIYKQGAIEGVMRCYKNVKFMVRDDVVTGISRDVDRMKANKHHNKATYNIRKAKEELRQLNNPYNYITDTDMLDAYIEQIKT